MITTVDTTIWEQAEIKPMITTSGNEWSVFRMNLPNGKKKDNKTYVDFYLDIPKNNLGNYYYNGFNYEDHILYSVSEPFGRFYFMFKDSYDKVYYRFK